MKIWNYNAKTGELLGANEADPDPMTPGGWLVPAYGTASPPGDPQRGRAQRYTGSGWENVADCRGETWWKIGAEFNTEPVVVDFIGDPSQAGLTNVEPPAPPAPLPPPFIVSPRQIRLVLSKLGYRADFEAAVAGADQDTKDTWQFASKFERGGVVRVVLEKLGKLPEEVDELFDLAKTL